MASISCNIHGQVCTLCLPASRGFLSAHNLPKPTLLELKTFHAQRGFLSFVVFVFWSLRKRNGPAVLEPRESGKQPRSKVLKASP